MIRTVCAAGLLFAAALCSPPSAHADYGGMLCNYPSIGVGVNIGGIAGAYCDGPTEINGSHWHCEAGGLSLGLGGAATGIGSAATFGIVSVGQGVGGVGCSWRCPDGTNAPAPNPPGAWQHYLIPMSSTNFCAEHMQPNGYSSAPVLPTEGIPPVNERPPAPGETLPAQPVPPPLPTPVPGESLILPGTAPSEP